MEEPFSEQMPPVVVLTWLRRRGGCSSSFLPDPASLGKQLPFLWGSPEIAVTTREVVRDEVGCLG